MLKLPSTTILVSSLVVGLAACAPSPESESPTTSSDVETSEPIASDNASDSTSESSESPSPESTNLQTYNETDLGIPVIAQYPDEMEVSGVGSGEGVGVFFTFKPQGNALDDASVQIFLPSGAASTGDLMPFITGENGLIANNGWSLDGSRADGVTEFPYPWFEMVFDISTDFEQSGHILIGQTEGQAVQVTLLYPSEMAEAYWLSANTVLNSLEFEASLLPIGTTSESEFEGEDPATMCDPETEPC